MRARWYRWFDGPVRKIFAVLGVLVLLPTAFVWWLVYSGTEEVDDSRFEPPGSVTVELDEGTYRIVVEDQLSNAKGCQPEDYFGEVEQMGLVLVPEGGKDQIKAEQAGSCDGGNNQDGPQPLSVSEFEVPAGGTYTFRGADQPPRTNNNKLTEVYLTDANDRPLLLVGGVAGGLIGGTLIWLAIPRRRSTG